MARLIDRRLAVPGRPDQAPEQMPTLQIRSLLPIDGTSPLSTLVVHKDLRGEAEAVLAEHGMPLDAIKWAYGR